jgi:Tfp pilus assembly protein PilO
MEIIGIVLLLALFILGAGFTVLFLRYLDLLRSVREINENVAKRLQSLEEKVAQLNVKKEDQ